MTEGEGERETKAIAKTYERAPCDGFTGVVLVKVDCILAAPAAGPALAATSFCFFSAESVSLVMERSDSLSSSEVGGRGAGSDGGTVNEHWE